MNCPKCNEENRDDAPLCSSCGHVLSGQPGDVEAAQTHLSRTLRLAVVSLVLGVLSIPTWAITAIPAIVVGIISLVKIEKSGGRLSGKGYAVVGIAIPAIMCSLIGVFSMTAKVRNTAFRVVCQDHLRGIGSSMLVYLTDWDDEYPLAGSDTTKWGPTPKWQTPNRSVAFALDSDGKGGQASISASIFTMCKSCMMGGFHNYICYDDPGTTEFTLFRQDTTPYRWREVFWDFGSEPSKHLSYTYHMPYGAYRLMTSSDPGMAVMADRNPWLEAPGYPARSKTDFASFNPNGPEELVRRGNTIPHKGTGQNVLFVDRHVAFEKTPNCGVNGDNIYTSQNNTDIMKGVLRTLTSQPANKNDSLLLHDPPRGGGE